MSAAAAYANLSTLLSDDFESKAFHIEKKSREILTGPGIVELRGRGAMLGLELESSELTAKVVRNCFDQGVILGWTLHSNSLIRIAPPLIIDNELLTDTLKLIRKAIQTAIQD